MVRVFRYFQRFGIPAAAALSAGVIDSVSELLVQITLFLLCSSSPAGAVHGAMERVGQP